MVKRIKISADNVTYTTLPGNTAEMRDEAGQLTDTIFGQSFDSSEIGLITATLQANALYKGFAGYVVDFKVAGTPTTMTGEAMSNVSGKIYQVTNTAHQILDHATDVVVYDNAVDHTVDVISIDYLTGTITFDASYTVTGPVTMDAKYVPTTAIAGARSFTLTQTANAIDNTDIPTAKANGGFRTFEPGLKQVSLNVGGVFKASNAFRDALIARSVFIVEINPDNSGLSLCRGYFKYSGRSQTGDVGALEEENLTLMLQVPDIELLSRPFGWAHSALTQLNLGVRNCLAAWEDETLVYAQYLYDGTNGYQGQAVVTDLSLSGGLEAMNTFSVSLQMSGAMSDVP